MSKPPSTSQDREIPSSECPDDTISDEQYKLLCAEAEDAYLEYYRVHHPGQPPAPRPKASLFSAEVYGPYPVHDPRQPPAPRPESSLFSSEDYAPPEEGLRFWAELGDPNGELIGRAEDWGIDEFDTRLVFGAGYNTGRDAFRALKIQLESGTLVDRQKERDKRLGRKV